jgi:hypothetical protein
MTVCERLSLICIWPLKTLVIEILQNLKVIYYFLYENNSEILDLKFTEVPYNLEPKILPKLGI